SLFNSPNITTNCYGSIGKKRGPVSVDLNKVNAKEWKLADEPAGVDRGVNLVGLVLFIGDKRIVPTSAKPGQRSAEFVSTTQQFVLVDKNGQHYQVITKDREFKLKPSRPSLCASSSS